MCSSTTRIPLPEGSGRRELQPVDHRLGLWRRRPSPEHGKHGRPVRRRIPESPEQHGLLYGTVRHVGLERHTWLQIGMSVDPQDGAGPCLEYPNMAWDVRTGELVVTGGYTLVDGGEYPNHQAWRFKFTDSMSGTWSKDKSPFYSCAWRASPGAAMAVDVTDSSGAKVFFGGFQNFPQTVAVGNTTFCE